MICQSFDVFAIFDDIFSLGDPNVSNMLHQVAPFHHPKERVGRHLSTKLNPNRFGPRERAAAIGCPRYDSIEPLRGWTSFRETWSIYTVYIQVVG